MLNNVEVFGPAIQSVIDHSEKRERNRSKVSIQQQFEIFHRNHPHIYRLLVAFAYEALKSGHKHLGIALLFERVRWEVMVETRSTDFKLNNNFRSRYVRLIEKNELALKGFFRKRGLRTL